MTILSRRKFFKLTAAGGIGAAISPLVFPKILTQVTTEVKPVTNVKDAMKYPRNASSMPGKFPGAVVHVSHDKCVENKKYSLAAVNEMIKEGMLGLTGVRNISEAWRMFVSPGEIIGLKVNPVAGVLLSTSLEIVSAVIKQMEDAGIPRKNIVIWDRREFELFEVGFNKKNFPDITVIGTERKDSKDSFYDENGKLYGEQMIDKKWYYWADTEGKYDSETLPYMINEGKYSYFSKILTQQIDKLINIPILKNAGPTITLCLKNLAFGSISNTGRLHKQLWAETCAEVCAFPPLRDKVVLNIVDGVKGCYNDGPAANEQFITEFKRVLIGTDPVAVDRVGYEIVLKKRIEEKIQKEESPKGKIFLQLAQDLKLGTADLDKIKINRIDLQ